MREIDKRAAWGIQRASVTSRGCSPINLIGEHTDHNGGLVLPCAAAVVLADEGHDDTAYELSGDTAWSLPD